MSLRTRISGLLLLIFGIVALTSYAIQLWITLPAFAELEKSSAERNVLRCVEAMEAEIESVTNLVNDWGAWDDNYYFAKGTKPEFIEANLQPEAFENAKMNLICVVNRDRQLLWGEIRDIETLEAIELPDLLPLLIGQDSPLVGFTDIDKHVSGIIQTSHGPLMIASAAIVTTDRKGPIEGWTMMGRFLNPANLELLSQRTHCELNAWQLSSESMPDNERAISLAEDAGNHPYLRIVGPDEVDGYYLYNDLFSQPAILFKVSLDRQLMRQGASSACTATFINLSGGFLVLLGMWAYLSRQIVEPLQRLSSHARKIGMEDDLDSRLFLSRSDEIGALAEQLNLMVQKLSESRQRVLSHAHRAGMAETAAEVLHNVGNAINSANCAVENVNHSLQNSKLTGLSRAIELLKYASLNPRDFFEQDPRAPKLVDYFSQLSDSLNRERAENSHEVERLRNTIKHIRDVISSQNPLTADKDFRQKTGMRELIDELRGIIEPKMAEQGIELLVNVAETPKLLLNKNQMVQVLLNLAKNAMESMAGTECSRKTLSVKVFSDSNSTCIDMIDTGKGFDEAVRNRLFSQGFTTRRDGSGLGLHYCANAVHQAGGSITALSDGPGTGATFRIRLPHISRETGRSADNSKLNGVSSHAS